MQASQGFLVGDGAPRFAKRHRQTLKELLGSDSGQSPSDSTLRLLLAQLVVTGLVTLLRNWMAAQPGMAEELDTLVSDGKTLRGSTDASGRSRPWASCWRQSHLKVCWCCAVDQIHQRSDQQSQQHPAGGLNQHMADWQERKRLLNRLPIVPAG